MTQGFPQPCVIFVVSIDETGSSPLLQSIRLLQLWDLFVPVDIVPRLRSRERQLIWSNANDTTVDGVIVDDAGVHCADDTVELGNDGECDP